MVTEEDNGKVDTDHEQGQPPGFFDYA